MNQSEVNQIIKEFLIAYVDWADLGAPGEHKPNFVAYVGLCSNISLFLESICDNSLSHDHYHLIHNNFKKLLPPGNKDYPFGVEEYFRDADTNSHHKNPRRLEWIKETIEKL